MTHEYILSHEKYFNHDNDLLYSPRHGLSIYNINMYTEFTDDVAFVFFGLLEKYNVKYGVFAGNSVGYVRDKRNMYWVDDYDILVFEEDGANQQLLKDLIDGEILTRNGLIANYHTPLHGISWIFNKDESTKIFFQCDIWYSLIDENDIVHNKSKDGLYTGKMKKHIILPFRKIRMGEINMHGVNDPEEEVKICYGDIKKGIISTHLFYDCKSKIKVDDWKTLDDFFQFKIESGVENVNSKIRIKEHQYQNRISISDDEFDSVVDLLYFISRNNTKILNVLFNDDVIRKYSYDIKFYFPDIIINYYCNQYVFSPLYLNKCDCVYFSDTTLLHYYQSSDIIYRRKPLMKQINLMTFGTFDLFHRGHKNIFQVCKNYSSNIFVGLSTDEFTFHKKSIYPFEDFSTRAQNIVGFFEKENIITVFPEESMDLKNEYIKQYDAHLLIMGDDWEGKFDHVDCPVIYPKRTEGISSTMLRNQLSSSGNHLNLIWKR
jgi:glycerol-3-phosphate cytidylyltransferase